MLGIIDPTKFVRFTWAHINELVYVEGLIEDYNEDLTNALWLELLALVYTYMARMQVVPFTPLTHICLFMDDHIVLSDSEEVDQEDESEDNKRKWDAAFDAMLDEEQQVLVWDTKKKLKGDLEDMDFEMSYARVNKKDYQDFDDNKDEDPKTLPHYHSDEFYEDSSSEE
ncbi:hypothetical protein FNV43_RR27222 [Rhamnella rubrinervis]|uniref:Uncharacterized protein n=1 Tax=Rhamnella rubrinervis TaxID=2594499 RepID=A0A8K0DJZ7_9ROSA|nr:hypothetical protein FNV43_RR27222 [Rhamnella rubrinervis]